MCHPWPSVVTLTSRTRRLSKLRVRDRRSRGATGCDVPIATAVAPGCADGGAVRSRPGACKDAAAVKQGRGRSITASWWPASFPRRFPAVTAFGGGVQITGLVVGTSGDVCQPRAPARQAWCSRKCSRGTQQPTTQIGDRPKISEVGRWTLDG